MQISRTHRISAALQLSCLIWFAPYVSVSQLASTKKSCPKIHRRLALLPAGSNHFHTEIEACYSSHACRLRLPCLDPLGPCAIIFSTTECNFSVLTCWNKQHQGGFNWIKSYIDVKAPTLSLHALKLQTWTSFSLQDRQCYGTACNHSSCRLSCRSATLPPPRAEHFIARQDRQARVQSAGAGVTQLNVQTHARTQTHTNASLGRIGSVTLENNFEILVVVSC